MHRKQPEYTVHKIGANTRQSDQSNDVFVVPQHGAKRDQESDGQRKPGKGRCPEYGAGHIGADPLVDNALSVQVGHLPANDLPGRQRHLHALGGPGGHTGGPADERHVHVAVCRPVPDGGTVQLLLPRGCRRAVSDALHRLSQR